MQRQVPMIDPALLIAARSNQQKATTFLTQKDGTKWKVERDLQGNEIMTPVSSFSSQFFVFDAKPDAEICTIMEGLHIGSQDAATNVTALQEKGVTHILNVAFDINNPFADLFTIHTCEIVDEPSANINVVFPTCFEFIDAARNGGGGVLVHCNAGISRSSTVVAAYLMQHLRIGRDDAIQLIRKSRPIIRPNDGFMEQLAEFEKALDG